MTLCPSPPQTVFIICPGRLWGPSVVELPWSDSGSPTRASDTIPMQETESGSTPPLARTAFGGSIVKLAIACFNFFCLKNGSNIFSLKRMFERPEVAEGQPPSFTL